MALHSHRVTSSDVAKHHTTWIRDSFFYYHLMGTSRDPLTGRVLSIKGLSLQDVSRDTRRHDISGLSTILLPINIQNTHWILAKIHLKDNTITLFDLLHGPNHEVYHALKAWLRDLLPHVETWAEASGRVELQQGPDCGIHVMMSTLSQSLGIQTDSVLSPPPQGISDQL